MKAAASSASPRQESSLIDTMVIGLGGQRCGSTWLHEQIILHPHITTPLDKKEIHFYDRYWDAGPDWYLKHFDLETPELTVWESTPNYLYEPEAPKRIASIVRAPRFVVLLRDPLTRSTSQYRRYLVSSGNRISFTEAVEERRNIIRFSRYSQFLSTYIDRFGRDSLFIGFYEDIRRDPAALLKRITDFMGVEQLEISEEKLQTYINATQQLRHPKIHATGERLKMKLIKSGFGGSVRAARKLGLRKLISASASSNRRVEPSLNSAETARLLEVRGSEVSALAKLGIDASHWTG